MTQNRFLTLAEIEKLMALMAGHEVTTVTVGDVTIARQPKIEISGLMPAVAAQDDQLTEEEALFDPLKGLPDTGIPSRLGA